MLNVDGGEVGCLFDFSGALRRSVQGQTNIPQGSLEIQAPPGTAARIAVEILSGGVDPGEGFTKKAGAFWNQAALAGQEPLLEIEATVLQGSIRLVSCQ